MISAPRSARRSVRPARSAPGWRPAAPVRSGSRRRFPQGAGGQGSLAPGRGLRGDPQRRRGGPAAHPPAGGPAGIHGRAAHEPLGAGLRPRPGAARRTPRCRWKRLPGLVRHGFTHFPLELTVFVARVALSTAIPTAMRFTPRRDLDAEPLPGVMKKVIAHAFDPKPEPAKAGRPAGRRRCEWWRTRRSSPNRSGGGTARRASARCRSRPPWSPQPARGRGGAVRGARGAAPARKRGRPKTRSR